MTSPASPPPALRPLISCRPFRPLAGEARVPGDKSACEFSLKRRFCERRRRCAV